MSNAPPTFRGGRNVALKLPERLYAETLSFYRDVLGLPLVHEGESGAVVDFGSYRLWLDRVVHQSQPDIWIELITDDTEAADRYLADNSIRRCDEMEKLPDGFDGYWIASPSGTIHLVTTDKG